MHAEDGQALVEFALVIPVLLAVVFGILTFGRAMNYNEQATHLAEVVARYAAVDQIPPNANGQTLAQWVTTRAQADSSELANGSGDVTSPLSVCVSAPNGTAIGQPVQVKLTFTFSWLPVLNMPSTPMTQTATMRIEVPPSNSFFAPSC